MIDEAGLQFDLVADEQFTLVTASFPVKARSGAPRRRTTSLDGVFLPTLAELARLVRGRVAMTPTHDSVCLSPAAIDTKPYPGSQPA